MSKQDVVKIDCNQHASSFNREEALKGDEYTDAMVEAALGVKAGEYTFVYDYPLSNKAKFKHTLASATTNIDVLLTAKADYETIYAAEDDPGHIPGMLNRQTSEGPYGIWGHDFSDLYFEGVTIDQKSYTVTFSMGS